MRRSILALAVLLALTGVACSGGEGAGGDAEGAAGAAGASGATGAAGGNAGCLDLTGEGPVFTLTISGFAFQPDCFTASASQGISIVNEDSAAHTFTVEGTQIDVTIEGGSTFNGEPVAGVVAPGTYPFVCRFHPSMTGEVTVVA